MDTVALASPSGKSIMMSAILASAMAFIDGTALNVVLPSLQKSLHADGTDLFWILNAYLLILAALLLIGGALGDIFGRKRIFMIGIVIFIIGSAACGFVPTVNFLIGCRMVQGLGGALMIPGSLSLISSSINKEERGKAIGTWSAVTTIVTMGGPILGGALADAGLWRGIFYINIPIGLTALFILWRKVHETKEPGEKPVLDFPGAVSLALGLASLTFGFLRIPDVGLTQWTVYVPLTCGIFFLVAFLLIEKYSAHPMMPLPLFRNPTFSGVNILTFFLYAGLGSGMLFLSLNMVQVQGYTQFQAGLTFLPFTLLMISIARYAGGLADKYGPRWLLIIGPAIAATGLLLLSFVGQTRGAKDYWTTFFPGLMMLGLGMSFTVAPLTATVMSAVSDQFSGTASGINNAMTRISNVFANAIFGALAVLFFSSHLQGQIGQTTLSPSVKQAVMAEAGRLGNAKAPVTILPKDKSFIQQSYHLSFISAYRTILRLSAGLGYLGVLVVMLMVRKKQ